jgi:hypothetical protein
MPLKLAPFVILAVGLAVIGYGLWMRQANPTKVVSTGVFQFKDKAGAVLLFPKRVVAVGGFETTQVQLPGGTWIDCRGDCEETIRAEYTEFWDSQMRSRR